MVFEIKPKPSYPIAAKLRGPGPAGYNIPPAFGFVGHIITKTRAPMFTMRPQLKIIDWTGSPGPAAYKPEPNMCNNGKIQPPAYSMGIILHQLSSMRTPGPGEYNVDNPNVNHPRSPAWYMALPGLQAKPNGFPGPNHYHVPGITGVRHPVIAAPPAFSMRIKLLVGSFLEDVAKSPGPARYEIVPLERVKLRPPAYSLRRILAPISSFNGPGPANYSPLSSSIKPHSPAYTMRIKHSEYLALTRTYNPEILFDWE